MKLLYNSSHSPSRRSSSINVCDLVFFRSLGKPSPLYVHMSIMSHSTSFQGTLPSIHNVWPDLRFHLPPPTLFPSGYAKISSHDFEMTACQDFITFLSWGSQCPNLSLGKQGEKFSPLVTFVSFVDGRKSLVIAKPLLMVFSG